MKCMDCQKHFQGKILLLVSYINTSNPLHTRTVFFKHFLDINIYPRTNVLYMPFRI